MLRPFMALLAAALTAALRARIGMRDELDAYPLDRRPKLQG
jgi:hypothetical protein